MTGALKDGDVRFARGSDSVSDPATLGPESYVSSVNMLNRGGVLQTRPGLRCVFTLPDGVLQGLSVFKPRIGLPVLTSFVSGVPYVSSFPFSSVREVGGARMSATAKRVYTEQTTKSVERNADGSLTLITPRSLLMVQDGVSPASYFDGRILAAVTGKQKTPQGTHMAWVGHRLWVARREQLFAGDIGDPFSAVEQEFNTLGGINYFILPGQCTGLGKAPGNKVPLLVFTDSSTTVFRSDILNRALWTDTPDFQSDLFPNLGCVASRSIVSKSGLLWWYSDFGLVNLNTARTFQVSSDIDFLDREMIRSSRALNGDVSGIASASYENFLLTSVPHASKKNRHTWVLDGSTNDLLDDKFPPAWSSVWTGVNPVQWVSVKINGRTRLFCASADDDGINRVYEAFTSDRQDNGCDIPWSFDTRVYTAGSIIPKHMRYLEYALSELSGQVDLKISWAGASRGRWKPIARPTFLAQRGNIFADGVYSSETPLFALKKQSRLDRTQDVRDLPPDPLSSAGIEGLVVPISANKEEIDRGFQIRFEGSGRCAVRALRLFMDAEAEPDSGSPGQAEDDDHFVRFDGAAADNLNDLNEAPEIFTASATEVAQRGNFAAAASASIRSTISQSDADKRAKQVARARAEYRYRTIAPKKVSGALV